MGQFFFEISKNCLIYRKFSKEQNGLIHSTFENYRKLTNSFIPSDNAHVIPKKNTLFIPYPKDIKYDYQINDDVYIWLDSKLYKGVIVNIKDHLFIVNTQRYRSIVSSLNDLVPYNWWILTEKCRLAMMELSKCLIKYGIYKDVRILISKYVWNTRTDYLWDCNHKHTRKRSAHKKIKFYY